MTKLPHIPKPAVTRTPTSHPVNGVGKTPTHIAKGTADLAMFKHHPVVGETAVNKLNDMGYTNIQLVQQLPHENNISGAPEGMVLFATSDTVYPARTRMIGIVTHKDGSYSTEEAILSDVTTFDPDIAHRLLRNAAVKPPRTEAFSANPMLKDRAIVELDARLMRYKKPAITPGFAPQGTGSQELYGATRGRAPVLTTGYSWHTNGNVSSERTSDIGLGKPTRPIHHMKKIDGVQAKLLMHESSSSLTYELTGTIQLDPRKEPVPFKLPVNGNKNRSNNDGVVQRRGLAHEGDREQIMLFTRELVARGETVPTFPKNETIEVVIGALAEKLYTVDPRTRNWGEPTNNVDTVDYILYRDWMHIGKVDGKTTLHHTAVFSIAGVEVGIPVNGTGPMGDLPKYAVAPLILLARDIIQNRGTVPEIPFNASATRVENTLRKTLRDLEKQRSDIETPTQKQQASLTLPANLAPRMEATAVTGSPEASSPTPRALRHAIALTA